MEGLEKTEGKEKKERDEIFSKAVRAGKRTYFFDVKATKRNDYYLTITESKKRYNPDGRHFFEKHKLFLYKEDFEKFVENLEEVINYIKENQPEKAEIEEDSTKNDFTNVEFEDLDREEKDE
ncbi:MAG: PUR family DNA/RNA-binding protein [Marinilabiliales bacterium]